MLLTADTDADFNVVRVHQAAHGPQPLDEVAAVDRGPGQFELLILACRLLPMFATAPFRPSFGFPECVSALIDPVVFAA